MADEDKNKELEKKKQRENTIKAESQGGVWITDQPNRNAEKNTGNEADFDRMKGIEDEDQEKKKDDQ